MIWEGLPGGQYPHLDLEVEEGQQLAAANWCPGRVSPAEGSGAAEDSFREVGEGRRDRLEEEEEAAGQKDCGFHTKAWDRSKA